MKARLILCAALVVVSASLRADDFRFQRDKQLHFAGSIGMGALANVVTDDPVKAFAGCAAVGAAAELAPKFTGHGVSSWHDFAYDVAGCAIGSYVGFKAKGLFIAPQREGVRVGFSKEF